MVLLHARNEIGTSSAAERASKTSAVTVCEFPIVTSTNEKSVTRAAGLPSRSESGSLLQLPRLKATTVRAPKAPKRRRFMRTSLDDYPPRELKSLDVLDPFRTEERCPIGPARLAAVVCPYQCIVPELRHIHEHELQQLSLRVLPDFVRQRIRRLRPLHHFLGRPVLDEDP